ncbi:hypothetical protein C8R44DRAFT_734926 [Mycena epipterygia]|nr:hypothetical protein C8R44DRAFT_734926 [Mycena epipterygia]
MINSAWQHTPLTVSSFEIHVAQRYSAILTANNAVDNYWINAPMDGEVGNSPTLNINNVKAILRYAGAPDADPTTTALTPVAASGGSGGGSGSSGGGSGSSGGGGSGSSGGEGGGGGGNQSVGMLQEFMLHTLVDPGAPNGANPPDQVIDLKFNAVWEISGIVYTPPTLPTLLKIINGATVVSDFNISEHTFILQKNEVVQLNIHGSDHGIKHPFHLQFVLSNSDSGHAFDIVQSAQGPLNFVNPPRRDVIAVEQGGVSIQFRVFLSPPDPSFLQQRTTPDPGSSTASPGLTSHIATLTGILKRVWLSFSLKRPSKSAWVPRLKLFLPRGWTSAPPTTLFPSMNRPGYAKIRGLETKE